MQKIQLNIPVKGYGKGELTGKQDDKLRHEILLPSGLLIYEYETEFFYI